MLNRLRYLLIISLCIALVWTSGGVAEASAFFFLPDASALAADRSFLRNEQQVGLETQALSARVVNAIDPMDMSEDPTRFPFLTHFIDRSRILMDRANQPVHPRYFPWFSRMDARALLMIGAVALINGFGVASHSHVLQACGNVIVLADPSISWWTFFRHLYRHIDLSSRRGHQSGGVTLYFQHPFLAFIQSGMWSRVKNFKRTTLALLLVGWTVFKWLLLQGFYLATFQWVRWWKLFRGPRQAHAHVRLTTAGPATLAESQTWRFLRPRKQYRWFLIDGKLVEKKVRVENTIGHNGDGAEVRLFDTGNPSTDIVPIDLHLGIWLKDVLNTSLWYRFRRVFFSFIVKRIPNMSPATYGTLAKFILGIRKSDSWKVSGLQDLFHDQGGWYDSVVAAYHLNINTSLADPILKKRARQKLSSIFNDQFKMLNVNFPSGAQGLQDLPRDARLKLAGAVIYQLKQDSLFQGVSDERLEKFVRTTIDYFADNNLLTATRLNLQREIGSFGLVASSSLEPGRYIAHSRLQDIFIGLSKDGKEGVINSSGDSVKPEWIDYQLPLKDYETAEVLQDPKTGIYMNLYRETAMRQGKWDPSPSRMSSAVMDARVEPLRDNPRIPPLPKPLGRFAMGHILKGMAGLLDKIRLSIRVRPVQGDRKPLPENSRTMAALSHLNIARGIEHLIGNAMQFTPDHPAVIEAIQEESERLAEDALDKNIIGNKLLKQISEVAGRMDQMLEPRERIAKSFQAELPADINHGFQYVIRYHVNRLFTESLRGELREHELEDVSRQLSELFREQQEIKERLLQELNVQFGVGKPKSWEDLVPVIQAASGTFWDRLYPGYASKSKKEQAIGLVAEKIYEMGYEEESDIEVSPAEAVDMAFESGVREMSPSVSVSSPIDILILGTDNGLWAGEQFAQDYRKGFKDVAFLNIQGESANKVLIAIRDQHDRHDFQIRLPGGGIVTRQTIIIALADEDGVGFPTVSAVKEERAKQQEDAKRLSELLGRPVRQPHRIFVMAGSPETPIGRAVGQLYVDGADFEDRIFSTLTPMPESEARVESIARDFLLTEVQNRLWSDIRKVFPGSDPFGLRFEAKDIRSQEKNQDYFVDKSVPEVTGYTPDGKRFKGSQRRTINWIATKFGLRTLDPWFRLAILIAYVVGTVALHMTTLGHWFFNWKGIHLSTGWLNALFQPLNILQHWIMMHLSVEWTDAVIYLILTIPVVYLWRWVTARPIMGRLGAPNVLFGDAPHTALPTELLGKKLTNLALASITPIFRSGNPGDHLALKETLNRGDWLILGLQDGRMERLTDRELDNLRTANQFLGAQSMGGNVDILTVGFNPATAGRFTHSIVLKYHVPAPQASPKRQRVLELLRESRFDSIQRKLVYAVLLYESTKLNSFFSLLWDFRRTKSGAGAPTTPTPALGRGVVPMDLDEKEPPALLRPARVRTIPPVIPTTQRPLGPIRKLWNSFSQQPFGLRVAVVVIFAIALILSGIVLGLVIASHWHVAASVIPPGLGSMRWTAAGTLPMIFPYFGRRLRLTDRNAPQPVVAAA